MYSKLLRKRTCLIGDRIAPVGRQICQWESGTSWSVGHLEPGTPFYRLERRGTHHWNFCQSLQNMVADTYSVRIKRFKTNPLLQRKQFAIDIVHPGRASIPKLELREKLSKLYKVGDPNCIILFGFKVAFGGGRSSGFGLIYDNVGAVKRLEKR